MYKLLLLTILFSNFNPADFTADGLWELVHEIDNPWVLVGRGYSLYMILKLFFKIITCFISLGQDYGCLYHLAPDLIGDRSDGTFQHGRVFNKGAFYLEGPNLVSGALDYIISSTYKPIIAVLIPPSHIAGI